MEEKSSINIWINEERGKLLHQAGLANLAQDVLAGMKVVQIHCTKGQKDKILEQYPTAKYDSATTKSIELLPAEMKNKLFNLIIKNKRLDIVGNFLENG